MAPLPQLPPVSPDLHEAFLHALTPVVDVFWTLVWSAVGSTITTPPLSS